MPAKANKKWAESFDSALCDLWASDNISSANLFVKKETTQSVVSWFF